MSNSESCTCFKVSEIRGTIEDGDVMMVKPKELRMIDVANDDDDSMMSNKIIDDDNGDSMSRSPKKSLMVIR